MALAGNPQRIVSSAIPKYHQLLVILRNQILTGELPPGARLPPDEVLSNTYGLSRGTVRKAVAQLEAERLIETERGVGSFVTAVHPNAIPFRFTDSIRLSSKEAGRVTFRVVAQELVPAPPEIADRLHWLPGTKVIHLARQRLLGKRVVAFSERFMPEQMLPSVLDLDLTAIDSLPDRINDETDYPLLRFDISLEAHLMNEAEAYLLEAQAGEPVIVFTRMTYSAPNQPAVWYRALFMEGYALNVWIDQGVISAYRENQRSE